MTNAMDPVEEGARRRKRGRPPAHAERLRSRSLNIRLTEGEHETLTQLAAEKGMTTTSLLRQAACLLMDIPDLGDGEVHALAEANRQLGAVGRNLNMAVRALQGGAGPGINVGLLEGLRSEVEAHRRAVAEILGHHRRHGARVIRPLGEKDAP